MEVIQKFAFLKMKSISNYFNLNFFLHHSIILSFSCIKCCLNGCCRNILRDYFNSVMFAVENNNFVTVSTTTVSTTTTTTKLTIAMQKYNCSSNLNFTLYIKLLFLIILVLK